MSKDVLRRLAAIVSADVVGYSRLMGADEAGTLATMRDHRRELWNPAIDRFGGRVVGTAGDSILVEFSSAVAAVECSIAIQLGMVERNVDIPDDEIMLLRIGVNIGEVIIEDDDIYGDGVNIAARLQEISEPGAIAMSGNVHEQIEGRLDGAFADDGHHEMKNIARPVPVWRWSPAGPISAAKTELPLGLPDKPSIVVLPFDNMSGDPEQEYFADGLTEDIITDLSRFTHLFVIARNTAFQYKGTKIDVRQVAKELGVRYVLEGSVRKAGNRVRITAQLIDGISGSHVSAERHDGMLEDVFDLQEEVTRKVVATVAPQIEHAERDRSDGAERRFDEAHDLAWRAYAKMLAASLAADVPNLEIGIEMAHRAIAMNPKCEVAYGPLCFSYAMMNLFSWGADPVGAADRALGVANAAMSALPQTDTAYYCLGLARSRMGQYDQSIRDLLHAHELNPNNVRVLTVLAWCEATVGDTKSAREHASEAMRLSPKDHFIGTSYLSLAMAAFIERDHEAFLEWAHRAIQAQPVAPIRRAMMIAHAAEVEDQTLIEMHLEELNRFAPDFIASLFRGENRLFAKAEHMNMVLDGLRKAGLPK